MTMCASRVTRGSALRLFCLPHAGGSGHVFRDWPAQVKESR